MDLKLKNKTAFISGSTTGIGYAAVRALVREGAAAIINGRTESKVQEAVQKLQKEFPNENISGVCADFSKVAQIEKLLEKLPEIDILVNNVGIYSSASFFETEDVDWQQQFEVNVMSGVRLSRKILPKMLSNNWGRILFISSEYLKKFLSRSIAHFYSFWKGM